MPRISQNKDQINKVNSVEDQQMIEKLAAIGWFTAILNLFSIFRDRQSDTNVNRVQDTSKCEDLVNYIKRIETLGKRELNSSSNTETTSNVSTTEITENNNVAATTTASTSAITTTTANTSSADDNKTSRTEVLGTYLSLLR